MPKAKIIFLILPQVHLLDVAGADQVFLEAKDYGLPVHVEYCTVQSEISTTAGLTLTSMKDLTTITPHKGDYVFVPGTNIDSLYTSSFRRRVEVQTWLHKAHEEGALICSICTGAFVLAQASLLNGRECTTHWKRTAQLQQMYPLTKVKENVLFVHDTGIYSSAGVSAGIDLALHIVSELGGEDLSFRVARELVVYSRRRGIEEQISVLLQYRNHLHSSIHAVQDSIVQELSQGTSIDSLAHIACMSRRSLTRLFRKETGISIGEYVRLVRREQAMKLLDTEQYSLTQVAQKCGLQSERQLRRILHS